jgi:hypothetical protein
MATAEHREPCESRGSCTVLGARGSETPPRDSTIATFFARRGFVMGVAIGSLSMFSIMSLLLYFNLYAQSRDGLGLTALEAGASLLPLSAALLALALSASAVDSPRRGRLRESTSFQAQAARFRASRFSRRALLPRFRTYRCVVSIAISAMPPVMALLSPTRARATRRGR